MVFVYILRLVEDKWYVGKTHDPQKRMTHHFNRQGADWTRRYPPREVVQFIETDDDWDEDKYTLQAMALWGVDNVRGGSFCRFELTAEDKITINKMIRGSLDCCFRCGSMDHFAHECVVKEPIVIGGGKNKKTVRKHSHVCCRCGRKGHYPQTCTWDTHLKGGRKLNK